MDLNNFSASQPLEPFLLAVVVLAALLIVMRCAAPAWAVRARELLVGRG